VPDTLERLARLAFDGDNHQQAAWLFGAAAAVRQRNGEARFPVFQADYDRVVAATRDALGQKDLIRHGLKALPYPPKKRSPTLSAAAVNGDAQQVGGNRLTPTERDVVRLVSEGLTNHDVATRLFVSPRTVQTHLTHFYTKLGLTSRVQLVHEAARHT
jgi:DNA-binding NarL/FixJ family response regulator